MRGLAAHAKQRRVQAVAESVRVVDRPWGIGATVDESCIFSLSYRHIHSTVCDS